MAYTPEQQALVWRIGERIADEVEKVAAGRQSDCEAAAGDIYAMVTRAAALADLAALDADLICGPESVKPESSEQHREAASHVLPNTPGMLHAAPVRDQAEAGQLGEGVASRPDLPAGVESSGQAAQSVAELLEMTGCRDAADLQDMANVGKALLERVADVATHGPLKNWMPADCPTEIVTDLANAVDEAIKDRDGHAEHVLRMAKECEDGLAALTEIDACWEACGLPGNRGKLSLSEQVSSLSREAEARVVQEMEYATAMRNMAAGFHAALTKIASIGEGVQGIAGARAVASEALRAAAAPAEARAVYPNWHDLNATPPPCDRRQILLSAPGWEGAAERRWPNADEMRRDLSNWADPPTVWVFALTPPKA